MGIHQRRVPASELRLIKKAVPRLHPIGACVRLNSGSPIGFVMKRDEEREAILVRFIGGGEDVELPEVCCEPA